MNYSHRTKSATETTMKKIDQLNIKARTLLATLLVVFGAILALATATPAGAQTIVSSSPTWKIDDADDFSIFPPYLAASSTTNTYLVALAGSPNGAHITPPYNQPWSLVFRGRGTYAGASNVVLTFTYGLSGTPYAPGDAGRTYRSTGFTWTIPLNGTNWVSVMMPSTNSGCVPVIFLETVATGLNGYTNGSLQRITRNRN